jgi:glycosyltransferase involved in cell wall biosynthesis
MKVSIVIPTYQCADLLGTTLNSIRLGGWDDIEVIVMDGASQDHIADVVSSFGDLVSVFVSEKDDGQYDAINKGMARASGEILCWINGGDFFMPGAIANAVEVFEKCPEAEWIAGRPCVAEGTALRKQGNHEVLVSNLEIRLGLCCGGATGFLQQEGMFWRRTLWEKAGPLDTTYRLAADYELWIRFSRTTDLVRLVVPLAAFSYHETNRSIVQRDQYMGEVNDVIAKFSDRERKVRRRLQVLPWALRIARKLPLVREMARFIVRRFNPLLIQVVSWKKTKRGGFKFESNRRVCWIR